MEVVLGAGILRRHSYERHSDRYGYVHLGVGFFFPDAPIGTYGTLAVRILEVRYPMSPMLLEAGYAQVYEGDVVVLGEGELSREEMGAQGEEYRQIGVKPVPFREEHWMDQKQIFRAQNQRVEILFTPK